MAPIALLADTHMPKGARRLPQRCAELVAGAEALVHAGDFIAATVLEELEALCPVVHAVHGNVDEAVLRGSLPEVLELPLGDRLLAVVHDAGPARGRVQRMRERFPHADAVLFGHSHMPLHESAGDFQIFNPGSPTERRRAPRRSMGMLHVEEHGLRFEHVWL
ncbi:MAG TPA: metallophosphoesterase family protein [Solirubrobacterales bacterium]|nr:metallophosphoesterase family protein [Solirubrobacterales bacterium]